MPAKIQIETAIAIVIRVALFPPLCAVNFLKGSTMAKNLSPDNAVSVKTDTPMERSLKNSDNVHRYGPHGLMNKMYYKFI